MQFKAVVLEVFFCHQMKMNDAPMGNCARLLAGMMFSNFSKCTRASSIRVKFCKSFHVFLWKAIYSDGTIWNPYCWKCSSKVKAVDIASCSISAKLVQSVKLKSLSLYFLNIFQALSSIAGVTRNVLRTFDRFRFSPNATAA